MIPQVIRQCSPAKGWCGLSDSDDASSFVAKTIEPLLSMVRGHLIEAMCWALDHKVASFKLLFDCPWKLVYLIKIDGPPASVVGEIVFHEIRQHALECMEMQVPDTISLQAFRMSADTTLTYLRTRMRTARHWRVLRLTIVRSTD